MFALSPSAATVTTCMPASKRPTWVLLHRRRCRPSLRPLTDGYRSVTVALAAPTGRPTPTPTSRPPEAALLPAAPWELPAPNYDTEAAADSTVATVTASAALVGTAVAPCGSVLQAAAFDCTSIVTAAGPGGMGATASTSEDGSSSGSSSSAVLSSNGSNAVGFRSIASSGRDVEGAGLMGRGNSATADADAKSVSSSNGVVSIVRSDAWLPKAGQGWGNGARAGSGSGPKYVSRGGRGGRSFKQGRGWRLAADTASAHDEGGGGGSGSGSSSGLRLDSGRGGGRGSTVPPSSLTAVNSPLLQELQAMQQQVAELRTLISEQQRREVEQRQQMEALLQYVLSGGKVPIPPEIKALPAAATANTTTAATVTAATVAAVASADHAPSASVASELQKLQRIENAADLASNGPEGTHSTAIAPPPSPPLHPLKNPDAESASIPVAAADMPGVPNVAPTELTINNTVVGGSIRRGSDSSSNNDSDVSVKVDDKEEEEAQVSPVSLAVQPELLTLLEQELNAGISSSNGNAVLGGSSNGSTDAKPTGSDSTVNGRAASGHYRRTDSVVSTLSENRTIISNTAAVEKMSVDVAVGIQNEKQGGNITGAAPPSLTSSVNGADVEVTHGSANNLQEELRHLFALELQHAAAPSAPGDVITSSQGAVETVGMGDRTSTVAPSPMISLLLLAASEKADMTADVPLPPLQLSSSCLEVATAAAHPQTATVSITAAIPPFHPAAASVSTSSGSSSSQMMNITHDIITTSTSSDSNDSSDSGAGSRSAALANESELRDIVAQLMSVASETARLARQAKHAGVPLPPELQQPAALPIALALLQRLKASKAGAGGEPLGRAPAAAVAPSAVLPESSAARKPPRRSGSGYPSKEWQQRSEFRSGGGAVGGGADGRLSSNGSSGGGSRSDRTEAGAWSAAPVASPTQEVTELTSDQLAALQTHPSYMFQGLRRLSWEGEEPLAAPAPSASSSRSSESAGLETPPPPLLRPPSRSARTEMKR